MNLPNDHISEATRELPEVQLPVIVYFHVDTDDQAEARNRIEQIRHVIETALADEDNDLTTFVYPEVRLETPKITSSGGFPIRPLDV